MYPFNLSIHNKRFWLAVRYRGARRGHSTPSPTNTNSAWINKCCELKKPKTTSIHYCCNTWDQSWDHILEVLVLSWTRPERTQPCLSHRLRGLRNLFKTGQDHNCGDITKLLVHYPIYLLKTSLLVYSPSPLPHSNRWLVNGPCTISSVTETNVLMLDWC